MDGDAEAERKMLFQRHTQQRNRLFGAILRGDDEIARDTVGVPQARPRPDDLEDLEDLSDLDEPERTAPQTIDDHFREHRNTLLFNLEWAVEFLPPDLLADWARRVGQLDLVRPEAGLAEVEAMGDEYRSAADRYAPHITQVSRGIEWDYHVPRIGREIEWLAQLFQHLLAFR